MTDDHVYPDVASRLAEQRELRRIACQRVLDQHREGRRFDAEVLKWAKHCAAVKPLGRPIGTGEPQ